VCVGGRGGKRERVCEGVYVYVGVREGGSKARNSRVRVRKYVQMCIYM